MNHDQEIRYSRHIQLNEIGKEGQQNLLSAKVLVVGAGGLGSSLLLYLAAAGVGTIGIVDSDKVDLSNLQRQVLHETGDIGIDKTQSAREAMLDLNPEVRINCHQVRLVPDNVISIMNGYDIVADGSDNFFTRFLVNDTCHNLGKTLVSAAVQGFVGQLATYKSFLGAAHPCYRCLHPCPPPNAAEVKCSESGVLGSVAGLMGAWQATEVIKEILVLGNSLSGSLITFDALAGQSKKITIPKNKECFCSIDKI